MTFLELTKYWVARNKRRYTEGLTSRGNAPKHLTNKYLAAVEMDLLILMYENRHEREDIKKELERIEQEIANGQGKQN